MNDTDMLPEIREALDLGRPVVALESTVITHGLPPPHNLETARAMEADVRAAGAIPATLALLGGRVRYGCRACDLETLAHAGEVRKCSPRDLPVVTAAGQHGSTTVAATMVLAHRVGIRVFATGGIGGVHRDTRWDVSADLEALREIPMTVVCAGAKAILDLAATLEVLETHGVTVIGYQTDTFPAFYSRSSGYPVDHRVETAGEVAALIRQRDALGLRQSILVTVPVPADAELDPGLAGTAIDTALGDARAQGICGKDVTPFLLAAVSRATGGQSRVANISLLRNNARVAADIACALARATG